MAINSDFVSKSRSMRRKQERRRNCFAVGTWNVRTLVESTGDERVCRKRPVSVIKPGNQCGDPDRKLNLVVRIEEISSGCCRDPGIQMVRK